MDDESVLFLALGESEVPAFRRIAQRLSKEGVRTKVVTWLPRLSGGGVQSLADRGGTADPSALDATLSSAGIADSSMAADFDRDWHFTTVRRKRQYVARIFGALDGVMRESSATTLVSSIGGEAPRLVAEALSLRSGLRRLYFNALPIPGRFVLLPALDAPFLPWQEDGRPLPLRQEKKAGVFVPADMAATGAFGLINEGLRRGIELVGRRGVYPPTWYPAKVAATVRRQVLGALEFRDRFRDQSGVQVRVLYPLHDERDFQVAVRERHAIPQEYFLLYVSSVLPPGFHLYVKPHPQHRADHHPLLWRRLHRRPNVTFLPRDWSAADAIDFSDLVLTLASSLGFEALQRGKQVACYGTPFYSRRDLTVDISDLRALPFALRDALGRTPDLAAVERLVEEMHQRSWPGHFTPLKLTESNLDLLSQALRDALGD